MRLLPALTFTADAQTLVSMLAPMIRDFLAVRSRTTVSVTSIKHYLQFNDFIREEYDYVFAAREVDQGQVQALRAPYRPLFDRHAGDDLEKAGARARACPSRPA